MWIYSKTKQFYFYQAKKRVAQMKTTIRDITNQTTGRIIAMSDIHGYVDYLKPILEQVHYTTEDTLVFVGDLIEKGPKSLETIRYVMKLREENDKVHVLMGNIEYSRIGVFFEGDDKAFYDAIQFAYRVWECGMVLEMLEEQDIDVETVTMENVAEVRKKLVNMYHKELNFLWKLPTMITCGNFCFVHAGIPASVSEKMTTEELIKEDAYAFMKIDSFVDVAKTYDKCVVVGHWPVCLYQKEINCMNAIFAEDKNVIAIDGGCALKIGAQLNALVIPQKNALMQECYVETYDDFPSLVASRNQAYQKATISIKYFDCEVKILEEQEDVVRVRHVSSGVEFWEPVSYLYKKTNGAFSGDFTDTWLEIQEGDIVKIVENTSKGMIVKKDGMLGWYRE